jgi:hypothetical protein
MLNIIRMLQGQEPDNAIVPAQRPVDPTGLGGPFGGTFYAPPGTLPGTQQGQEEAPAGPDDWLTPENRKGLQGLGQDPSREGQMLPPWFLSHETPLQSFQNMPRRLGEYSDILNRAVAGFGRSAGDTSSPTGMAGLQAAIHAALLAAQNPKAPTLGQEVTPRLAQALGGNRAGWLSGHIAKPVSALAGLGVDMAGSPLNLLTLEAPAARGVSNLLGSTAASRAAVGADVEQGLSHAFRGLAGKSPEAAQAVRELVPSLVGGGPDKLALHEIASGYGAENLTLHVFDRMRAALPADAVPDHEVMQAAMAATGNVQRALQPGARLAGRRVDVPGEPTPFTNEPPMTWEQARGDQWAERADQVRDAAVPQFLKDTSGRTAGYYEGEAAKHAEQLPKQPKELGDQIDHWKKVADENPDMAENANYAISVLDQQRENLKASGNTDPERMWSDDIASSLTSAETNKAQEMARPGIFSTVAQGMHPLAGVDPIMRGRLEHGLEEAQTASRAWQLDFSKRMKGLKGEDLPLVWRAAQEVSSRHPETPVLPDELRKLGVVVQYPLESSPEDITAGFVRDGKTPEEAAKLTDHAINLREALDKSYELKSPTHELLSETGEPLGNPQGYGGKSEMPDAILRSWLHGQPEGGGVTSGGINMELQMTPRYANATRAAVQNRIAELEPALEAAQATGDEREIASIQANLAKLNSWKDQIPVYDVNSARSLAATRSGVERATQMKAIAENVEQFGVPEGDPNYENAKLSGWTQLPALKGTKLERYLMPPQYLNIGKSLDWGPARGLSNYLSWNAAAGITGPFHNIRVAITDPIRNMLLGGQGPAEFGRNLPEALNTVGQRVAATAEGPLGEKIGNALAGATQVADKGQYGEIGSHLHMGEATNPLLDVSEKPSWSQRLFGNKVTGTQNPLTRSVRTVSAATEDVGAADYLSSMKQHGYSPQEAWERMRDVYPSYSDPLQGRGWSMARMLLTYPQFYGEMGWRLLQTVAQNPAMWRVPGYMSGAQRSLIPARYQIPEEDLQPSDTLTRNQVMPTDVSASALKTAAMSALGPETAALMRAGKPADTLRLNADDRQRLQMYTDSIRDPTNGYFRPKGVSPTSRLSEAMLVAWMQNGADPKAFPLDQYGVLRHIDINKFGVVAGRVAGIGRAGSLNAMMTPPVRTGAMWMGSPGDYGTDIHPQGMMDTSQPAKDDQGNQALNQDGTRKYHKSMGIWAHPGEYDFARAWGATHDPVPDPVGRKDKNGNVRTVPALPPGFFWARAGHNEDGGERNLLAVSPTWRRIFSSIDMLGSPQSVQGLVQHDPAARWQSLLRTAGFGDTISLHKLSNP